MESRVCESAPQDQHPAEASAEGSCRLNPAERKREWEKHGSANWGIGPARDIDAILRFNDAVMNWISEATTLLYHDHSTCDGARTIISEAADRCWAEYGLDNTVHTHTTPARCSVQNECTKPDIGPVDVELRQNLRLARDTNERLEGEINRLRERLRLQDAVIRSGTHTLTPEERDVIRRVLERL